MKLKDVFFFVILWAGVWKENWNNKKLTFLGKLIGSLLGILVLPLMIGINVILWFFVGVAFIIFGIISVLNYFRIPKFLEKVVSRIESIFIK